MLLPMVAHFDRPFCIFDIIGPILVCFFSKSDLLCVKLVYLVNV